MMKSVVSGLTAWALLSAASVNAEVIPSMRDALPQEYQDNGVKVAVFNDWAPDEFLDSDGVLKGWSVDIAHEIESRLGVPFAYEATSFDAIIPGLESGRFDAGFSSFGSTPERLKVLDFVAQRKIGTAFGFAKDSELVVKKPEDACGLTVAVLTGAWDAQLVEKLNKEVCDGGGLNEITMQDYTSQAQAELAVRSGRAQATVASSVKLAYIAAQTGDMKVSDLVLDPVNSNIGVRKGDPLGQVMTEAIQSMIDDGSYKAIMEKWGIADSGMLTKALLITEENPDN